MKSRFRFLAVIVGFIGHALFAIALSSFPFPIVFEQNRGQSPMPVRYLARTPKANLFLSDSGIDIAFPDEVIHLEFLHTKSFVPLSGEQRLLSTSNYFVGHDPTQWHSGVPQFSAVRYRGLYPGVDAEFYGKSNTFEYDLIVQPGADLRDIAFRVSGAQTVHVEDGDLVLQLTNGKVRWKRPLVYQTASSGRRTIEGSYVVSGNRVTFRIGKYDPQQPLVIDPVLDFSTYLGGSGDDAAYAVATDLSGAIYVTGMTQSMNFPATSDAYKATGSGLADMFVTKLKSDTGEIVYSTYLGGSAMEGDPQGYVGGIAVDSQGNAYVAGVTRSSDFPTTPNAFQPAFGSRDSCSEAPCGDAFVFKLNSSGTALIYSSFLGGSNHDVASAIAIDTTGAAYVAGNTTSVDFPVTPNAFQRVMQSEDAFISKISPDGSSLEYSTLLGGTVYESALAIAVDKTGAALVAGTTNSPDFPTVNALDSTLDDPWDAFITKLTPDGSALEFSTLLGGEGTQQVLGIAIDTIGDIYVTGYTDSADFPIVNAFQPAFGGSTGNGFVTKLKGDGSAIVYSTFLGGHDRTSELDAIAVNSRGEAFVAGTGGVDFPTVNSARPYSENGDVVLAKLTPDGSAVYWSTFFGGYGEELASGIDLDAAGNIVIAGQTTSANMPAALPQPTPGGLTDTFIARFADSPTNGPILSSPKLVQTADTYINTPSPPASHRISNPGNRTLHINQMVPSSNVGIVTDCIAVAPTTSCTLTVYLTPSSAAPATGIFTVYDDAPDSPQTFTVRGGGNYGGDLEVVSLTGGNVFLNSGLPTLPMTALVRNNGPHDAESVILRISNNVGGTDCNPCGLGTLKSGTATTVRFNRTSNVFGTIPITATVTASSRTPDLNSANDSKTILAAVPVYTASPAELTFSAQAVNSLSAPQRIFFSELGAGPFQLSFTLSGDFTQTGTCGTNDAACYIDVTFAPTASGTRNGILSVYESTAGTTQQIPLTGSGILAPYASFSATALDFGTRMIGCTTAPRIVKLTNTGSAPLQIASISVYGDFAQTHNCPASLSAGSSCDVSATFTPLASGMRTANLLIQDSASGNPHSVVLTGVGTASAAMLTPSSLDFFAQRVNTSSVTQSISVTNISGNPLHISSITVPPGYQQTSNCTTLQPDTSCAISVLFRPTQMGTTIGSLALSYDSAGSPRNVELSGFGIQSSLNIVPASLDFGSVQPGLVSAPQAVTLTNTGNSTLLFATLETNGPFSFIDGCSPALMPGESCNLQVTFQPQQIGPSSSQLLVSSDASQSPHSLTLSGIGSEPTVATIRPARGSRSDPNSQHDLTSAVPPLQSATNPPEPTSIPLERLFTLTFITQCDGNQYSRECLPESVCDGNSRTANSSPPEDGCNTQ